MRSLEWAESQARLITSDNYNWKWLLISLHGAVQGIMVLALWNGNGLLTLRDGGAKKWMTAYETCAPYPPDKLDSFLSFYKKVKDKDKFHTVGAGPFHAGPSHDKSMEQLNDIRNQFIHFTPKGWSLELAGLPRICTDALDVIKYFGWVSATILWHNEGHVHRLKQAVDGLHRSMTDLQAAYTATMSSDPLPGRPVT